MRSGEILGLIGPNGAGKTTLFSRFTGYLRVDAGKVEHNGQNITNLSANRICSMGIARTFQVVQILQGMRRCWRTDGRRFPARLQHQGSDRRAAEVLREVGMEHLAQTRHAPHASREETPGGGHVPRHRPEVLMLDECMAGLTPTEIQGACSLIRSLRERGMALVVVET